MNKKLITLSALAVFATGVASSQAKYDMDNIQLEKLGRGVVAIRENPEKVAISWRLSLIHI